MLQRVWSADGPVSHAGQYWSFEDAYPQPWPVQRPHPPLWVATDSPDGLAQCAANDWGVLLPQGTSPTVTAGQVKRYAEALAGVGAGLEDGRVYLARAAHVATTDEQAWAEARGPYEDFLGYADKLRRAQAGSDPGGRSPFDLDADLRDSALFGSPDTVLSRLREIRELGVERVMLFLHMGGLPHDRIVSSLDLLAAEVLPVVREW